MDAADVTLAILTGRRPHLLSQTLEALPAGLLDSAHVVVVHNGASDDDDDETVKILDRYPVDLKFTVVDGMWTIGRASSELLNLAVAERRSFTVYLQDDWVCRNDGDWLTEALRILDDDPTIGQVRLRLVSEQTYINHTSITGEKVRWTHLNGYRVSGEADWSLNPFAMRTDDIPNFFTDTSFKDEKDGMRQFRKTGKRVAQLKPGVFAHAGGQGASLRTRMDKERRLRRA